jgi:DNA polymerase I-like protein with 3'-5' exonuclease and polymerase domains
MNLFDKDTPSISFTGMSREEARARMMKHMLPASPWHRPEFFDVTGAVTLGYDIESHDPLLQEKGPGFIRGDAYVIGLSVSATMRDGTIKAGYFPMRHETDKHLNFAPEKVYEWLGDVSKKTAEVPKIGANLLYDLEGTLVDSERTTGRPVTFDGPIYDVQIAEPLLDEETAQGYSLEVLSKQYVGVGKTEKMLKAAAAVYGIPAAAVKSSLKKMSPMYVGPYGEDDSNLAVQVFMKQKVRLEKEELWSVFLKESRLIPLLLKMRLRGVPVDIAKAEQVNARLLKDEVELQRRLDAMTGRRGLDVWSNIELGKVIEKSGIKCLRTAKGNVSVTKDWLKEQAPKIPYLKLVLEVRKMSKMRRDFVEGFILETNVKGRLHCQFHQLRQDEDGTRSGRFSSSNPNLQQIPARDPVYGPLIRGMFVPEHGQRWGCWDLSAQEPRWTVHYANLCRFDGAAAAVEQYNTDPNTDYHQWTATMSGLCHCSTLPCSCGGRKKAKFVNLGLAYGMGKRKLAAQLGYITDAQIYDRSVVLPPEVDEVFVKYHAGVPYVRQLQEACARQADKNKFIKTCWGRKRHFNLVERAGRWKSGDDDTAGAMTLEEFKKLYPNERPVTAHTHKSLNALIQGSSADHMKQIMLDIGDVGYVPFLTVHDELDDSVENERQFNEVRDIMVNAIKLSVPVVVDAQLHDNWGECK